MYSKRRRRRQLAGLQEDVISGIQRWKDPLATVKGYAEVPTLPIGTIAGLALPILALLFLMKGRR